MSTTEKPAPLPFDEFIMKAADDAFGRFEPDAVDKYGAKIFEEIERRFRNPLIVGGRRIPFEAVRDGIIEKMNIKTARYLNDTDIRCPYRCWPEPPLYDHRDDPEMPSLFDDGRASLRDVVEELRKGRESTERRAEAEAKAKAKPKPKGSLYFEWLEESEDAWREWLIVGVIGRGEFSMWVGDPSAGKSILIGNLAFHVAYGSEFLGFKLNSCPVVYFAAERHKMVKRRLRGLRNKYGPTICVALASSTARWTSAIRMMSPHSSPGSGESPKKPTSRWGLSSSIPTTARWVEATRTGRRTAARLL
jgi:hypothetical protein